MQEGTSVIHARRDPVRLLVACRDLGFAHAVASSIAAASKGEITGSATDMRWLARKAHAQSPDVLLVEHAPDEEKRIWEALERVRGAGDGTRVVLLCRSYSHLELIEFVRRDVSGCVLASGTPAHWAQAVLAVHLGQPWFRRTALLRALKLQVQSAPLPSALLDNGDEPLTSREQEILALVGNGLTNKEIGRRLQISDKTVKTHVHHIYRKLNQSGRYKILLSHRAEAQASAQQAVAA